MHVIAGEHFEFSVVGQYPSFIEGSIGILELLWCFEKLNSQFVRVNKSLTDETFSHPAIQKCEVVSLFLCSV